MDVFAYECELSEASAQTRRLPWLTFIFILVVFYLAPPLRTEWALESFAQGEDVIQNLSAAEMAWNHLSRSVAMTALLGYAIVSLFHKEPVKVGIKGLLGWLMALYVLWASLSATWSEVPVETLRKTIVLWGLGLGALTVARRFSLREIISLTFFVCGITLLISIGVEAKMGTLHFFASEYRFCGIMHPIDQAFNCGLLAIAALSLAADAKRGRMLFIAALAISLLFLTLTRSRMALICTIMAGGAYLLLLTRRPLRNLLVVSLVMVGIACFTYLIADNILEYNILGKDSRKVVMLGRDAERNDTLNGRIPLWRECLLFAAKRPILGYGYNSFMTTDRNEYISRQIRWNASHTHSGYINALMGLGVVGAALIILIMVLALCRSIILSKSRRVHAFSTAVLVWLCLGLLLETNIIVEPLFPTFLSIIVLTRLGFIRSAVI